MSTAIQNALLLASAWWRCVLISVLLGISVGATAQDSDVDGIADALDIDDDNDGLTDIEEGCYDTDFPGDRAPVYTGTPNVVAISHPFNSPAFPPSNANVLNIIVPASVSNLTAGSGFNASHNGSNSLDITNLNATDLNDARALNEYLAYSFTTQSAVFVAYLDWFGYRTGLTSNPTFNATFEISTDGFSTPANTTVLGTLASGAGQTGTNGRRALDIVDYALMPATTYSVRIYIHGLSSGTALNFDDPIIAFDYCRRDTDGDGIVDALDLDADNDGCLDAIEGSGSFLEVDLTAIPGGAALGIGTGSSAGSALNLGTAVDANGLPTVAGGGQSAGFATVPAALVIDTGPANQALTAGDTATFSVVANVVQASAYGSDNAPDFAGGTVIASPASYQWQFSQDGGATWVAASGADVVGENSDTLSIANITSAMDGQQVRVLMTCNENECPLLSEVATLSVDDETSPPQEPEPPAPRPVPVNSAPALLLTALLLLLAGLRRPRVLGNSR
ncbi:hypothetical protein [Parahaliea mediterranea]|uniref:hypothetical protein n=1 Tax=Parahaliea mediterranea TaxID=651086 RepID=UPI001300249A|nr:hypothetical protein [Parahaliea mediterranea]